MLSVIPTAVADIESTHETNLLIYNHHFFVMTPQQGNGSIGVSIHFDIVMEGLEIHLDMLGIIAADQLRFHEHDDIYFDSTFGAFFQNTI